MRFSPLEDPKRLGLFLALAAALGAVGCGPDVGKITGKVNYNGAVVKGGNISFYDAEGHGYNGIINEDGTYTVDKVPVGEMKVTVETETIGAAARAPGGAGTGPPPGGQATNYKGNDPAEAQKRYVPIPPVYGDMTKTPLKYTVKSGPQTYDPPLQ